MILVDRIFAIPSDPAISFSRHDVAYLVSPTGTEM